VRTKGAIQSILLGAALLLVAGCDEEEKYALRFSHDLHVTENGMECSDCHGEVGTDSFRRPTHETCSDCHDEVSSEEVGPDTCGICHREQQLPMLQAEPASAPAEAQPPVFVHSESLAGKCQECHASIMDKELEHVPSLQRSEVLAIRGKAHASGEACSTCHVGIERDVRPGNHNMAWTKRHGMFGTQPDASCTVCHSGESCAECHSVMQPATHNNLWRLHSHGAVAAWDRAACMVCHLEDSCTSCHAQTRPRSHTARWAAPGFKPTHCIGCHNTSSPGDGCATCHEGGNDVLLHEKYWGGAPVNHNQPGIENCYLCHWTKTP